MALFSGLGVAEVTLDPGKPFSWLPAPVEGNWIQQQEPRTCRQRTAQREASCFNPRAIPRPESYSPQLLHEESWALIRV